MKESWLVGMLEKLELFLYRRADAGFCHAFKHKLIGRGINGEKIHVVTNGVDSKRFYPMEKNALLQVEMSIENCFVAGYIGTHGMAHALDTLLDAAAILQGDPKTQHIRILFLGDGAKRDGLLMRAEAMGLRNVIFRDPVTRDEIPAYWSVLDVALIHLRRSELFTTVIPSKIFESMGMGIPIVLGVEGEAAEIVRQSAAGVTFEPENSRELAEKLKNLSNEPYSLKQMSSAGVATAKKYDRVRLAHMMMAVLQKVTR